MSQSKVTTKRPTGRDRIATLVGIGLIEIPLTICSRLDCHRAIGSVFKYQSSNPNVFICEILPHNGFFSVSSFIINPFSTIVSPLNPLKISGKRRFSDVFRGFRNGTLVENGLMKLTISLNQNAQLKIFIF